jgi:hypothetical protein
MKKEKTKIDRIKAKIDALKLKIQGKTTQLISTTKINNVIE